MQTKHVLTLGMLLGLGAATSGLATPQPASRFGVDSPAPVVSKGGAPTIDAFGDPNDFGAALLAGADYLVRMQADATEDNAGNGMSDGDPDDAGWDWYQTAPVFEHSSSPSPTNTMGETAQGLLKAWQQNPDPTYMTAMSDVADRMIAAGPSGPGGIRSSSDVVFLMEFSNIAVSPTPAACQAAALAIWAYQLGAHGGTATAFAEYLRDLRGVTQGYPNGIVPWDLGGWAVAVQALGIDADADAIAEVMWQDAFNNNPGLFQPYSPFNQGFDPTWGTVSYWWYTLGITGLIDAFTVCGVHAAELPGLHSTLLACQYPDGAFSGSYGASNLADDRDWQTTGYVMSTMGANMTGAQTQINEAAHWLAATQDASGGFVYGDNSHYPSVVGQCVAGLSFSEIAYHVDQDPLYLHLAVAEGSPYTDRVSTNYSLSAGTEAYRSLTVFVDYDPAVLTPTAITQVFSPANSTFQTNLPFNPNGQLEITLAILGPTPGISGAVPSLFTITWNGILEEVNPGTTVHINHVVMRDPMNADIFAAGGADVEIEVDDSDPTLAVTPPAEPCVNASFNVTLDADDNVNLDRIEYQFDGAGAWLIAVPSDWPADSFFDVFLVDISGLSPGDHTITWRCWDDVGYSVTLAPWTFHKDFIAPTAATSLVAMPRDHSVHLSWTAGNGLDGYEVWRAKRGSDYPYPAGRPPLSAWPAAYTHVDDLGPGAVEYDDDDFPVDSYATRGIYDYVLVSVDCVNADAASAPASATNYFLGDWADASGYGEPYDGSVCFFDLNFNLAGQYGNLSNAGNNEMDVAPTHNMGRFGLPGPDGRLNFEDLIILAMNYRDCGSSPLLQIRRGEVAAEREADVAGSLILAGSGAERQLLLDGELLGLTAELASDTELLSVTSTHGTALFYPSARGWTVDVVGLDDLLSEDTVISLHFDGQAQVSLLGAEGRDVDNTVLPLTETTVAPPAQPAVFALAQNHPNPFNPVTTIRYSLATEGSVRLTVYNSMGQLVRVLQDGPQAAGAHDLSFDASALASGVYLYRLEAEGFTAQQKMILVK